MLIQQHLELLAIQYNLNKLKELSNLITIDNIKTGTVDKSVIDKLDIKCRSPKLSKILSAIGLDNDVISNLLGGQLKQQLVRNKITNVVNSEIDILNQSNSIYFTSCQTTRKELKDYISSYATGVDEDVQIAAQNELFLWVVGENYEVDKRGFISRAKLRTMYLDFEYKQIGGLFVDRIYGTASLLMDNCHELYEWWNNYSLERWGIVTPIYEASENKTEAKFFLPSANYGYQDYVDKGSNNEFQLIQVTKGNLIKSAYKIREKERGVYKNSIKQVKYNPQNYKIEVNKKDDKRWRGLITKEDRKIIKLLYNLTGKHQNIKIDDRGWCKKYIFDKYIFRVEDDQYSIENENETIFTYDNTVRITNEELGFYKAEELPVRKYYWNNYYSVTRDIPEYGYMQAEELPYLWEKLWNEGWKIMYPNEEQQKLGYARAVDI